MIICVCREIETGSTFVLKKKLRMQKEEDFGVASPRERDSVDRAVIYKLLRPSSNRRLYYLAV